MVFRRFRGQASGPSPEASLMTRVKMHEEDGWAEVGDVKQQRADNQTTARPHSIRSAPRCKLHCSAHFRPPEDEEAFELDEAEEIWDSGRSARNQFIQVQELETTEIEMTPDVSPEPPEEHGYRCRGCNACIFHGSDILSSNYQAMTGPGYLIDATQNTTAATDPWLETARDWWREDTQTVVYTTGSYVIREVSCEFCDNKLGVTYKVAPDARNEYKVGKFLLGADRLVLPPGVTHPKADPKIRTGARTAGSALRRLQHETALTDASKPQWSQILHSQVPVYIGDFHVSYSPDYRLHFQVLSQEKALAELWMPLSTAMEECRVKHFELKPPGAKPEVGEGG
eukprot:g60.t1